MENIKEIINAASLELDEIVSQNDKLERRLTILKAALIKLVGAESREDLEGMLLFLQQHSGYGDESSTTAAINAINVLLQELQET